MFKIPDLLALGGSLLLALGTASAAHTDYVDPSGRVAYLSDSRGDLSYSPAGEDDWIQVVRNRPLIRGDRLWTDRNARAEIQVGSAALRIGANTSFEILNLDDQNVQVQVTQGTINLRVRRMNRAQVYEVATPNLAFTINRVGRYRIDVDPDEAVTTIVVWDGAGVAYGDRSNFPLQSGDAVRFYDTDLRDYEMFGLPRSDAFDRYVARRDRRLDRSVSLNYLADDVPGYASLDEYGNWRGVQGYGNVWFPSQVNADWAPYQDGHWVWQEPWGWTWVDAAPWGFAPSHYGRWTHLSGRWGWIPGPRNVRPIYAPALVAFVGGRGWSASFSLGGGSPIGWFPLGPRDVYVPSYQTTRNYFNRVNVNNTVINHTTITNVYNNYASGNAQINQSNYANRSVSNAITAVPGEVFVNARSVRGATLTLGRNAASAGEISRFAAVAPSQRSVLGAGATTQTRPAREVLTRPVFARTAPPPEPTPFAEREALLQRNPGRAPAAPAKPASAARNADRNLRVLAQPGNAINARSAGGGRGQAEARSNQPATLKPLDRASAPGQQHQPAPANRGRRPPAEAPVAPTPAADQIHPATPSPRSQRDFRPKPSARQQPVATPSAAPERPMDSGNGRQRQPMERGRRTQAEPESAPPAAESTPPNPSARPEPPSAPSPRSKPRGRSERGQSVPTPAPVPERRSEQAPTPAASAPVEPPVEDRGRGRSRARSELGQPPPESAKDKKKNEDQADPAESEDADKDAERPNRRQRDRQ
ncbi:MAG: hypothetical protein COS34_05600 [Lysobacterales bacterium CG02_land_8_20_14_3_00_62_12]|nr:MAG: hypothetical protein COS34_05600 [Xanthomonadales bacterium CG02_land_8_20_14_3_00_62_12]